MNHPADTIEVWLVEDHALFRETIADLLNEAPDVDCALQFPTCEEALAALENDLLPDVILMDIGLPGMSGLEGVGRIKVLVTTPLLFRRKLCSLPGWEFLSWPFCL